MLKGDGLWGIQCFREMGAQKYRANNNEIKNIILILIIKVIINCTQQ